MDLNQSNRQILAYIFMIYNVCMCALLSSSLLTLTTLGDYRQYRGKLIFNITEAIWFEGLIPNIQTENLTIFLYTYLKLAVLPSWVLGFLLFSFIIFRYIRKQRVNYLNIAIAVTVFNPISLQYFYFESKEFLSVLFFIISIEARKIKSYLSTVLLMMMRKENLLIVLTKIRMRGKLMIFFLILIFSTLILDFLGVSQLIFIIIENSFAVDANTHRDWVSTPSKIYSFEALYFLLIGAYTTIFSFFPSERYFLFFFPLGVVKLFLILKVFNCFKLKEAFFIMSILGLYCIPLSVYNVGSSTRYVSVAWIVLWLLVAIKENKESNLMKVKFGNRIIAQI